MCYILATMKVHFACKTMELKSHKSDYRKICALIKEMGHTITRDWLEAAIDLDEKNKMNSFNREEVYNKVVAAIFAADVLIVEGTVASFSVGHQMTLGLAKNKPTLCLIKKSKNKKAKDAKHAFLGGIISPFLKVVEYDDSNLVEILNDFLNYNGGNPLIKFNIVLTKEIEGYLDWVSFTQKINKSEYIRDLILKNMKEDDKQYNKFLKIK